MPAQGHMVQRSVDVGREEQDQDGDRDPPGELPYWRPEQCCGNH